jgi:hypothetical protein
MPHLPIRRRNGDPTEPPQIEDLLKHGQIEDLLSNGAGTAAAEPEWQPVSELLQAAAGPATGSELTGEAAAMAAFRRGHLGVPTRRPLVRPRMLTTLLSGKIAAALACAALGVTGAAGAAFANVLPEPIQNLAHNTIGAPQAHSHANAEGDQGDEADASASHPASESAEPSESSEANEHSASSSATATASANAHAANGLCVAWTNAVAHGLDAQVGFRDKLATMAGGIDKITAFCATVKHEDGDQSEHASASATSTVGGDDENGHGNSDHSNKGAGHDHDNGATASPTPSTSGS